MKKKYSILFILLIIFSTIDVAAQVNSKRYNFVLKSLLSKDVPTITIAEASLNSRKYLFLDAREEEEYNVSHLKNARFVGAKKFNISALHDLNKDKPIVVYCSIGKRSQKIAQQLLSHGFTHVENLYGGLFEWVNQGYPVYDLNDKETKRVHIYGKFWGSFLERGIKVNE